MATNKTKLAVSPKIGTEIGTEIGGDANDTQENHTTP
jgi:hypothetical protein